MILGVVPLAMSVWKPEIAPQAMVMKQNGNTLPATTRPVPSDEPRERGHLQIRQHEKNAEREREDGAEFHERAEVIARREQQPHRQHAGRQAVKNDRPGQRDVAQAEDL
jgi:hypothetical protein